MNEAINNALNNLSNVNEMLCDYWISQLYNENDEPIQENWNERTLKLMEDDVMNQMLAWFTLFLLHFINHHDWNLQRLDKLRNLEHCSLDGEWEIFT